MKSREQNLVPDPALREAAETRLAHVLPNEGPERPAADLLHELRVHQIELEMQNESLRQAQNALEASRDLYVDLYELAPIGYATLTADGTITKINLTGSTLLGVERMKLLQHDLTRFVVPEEQGRFRSFLRGLGTTGGRASVEVAVKHPDGVVVQVQLHGESHAGDGGAAGGGPGPEVRIALTDITARKAAEAALARSRDHLEQRVIERTAELAAARDAAEAANRAKSVFLATMSHELRTPLNGVMGMIELVRRKATDPRQIDWLNKGHGAAAHLLGVLNDILHLAQIEAGQLMLADEDLVLSQVVREAIEIQGAVATAKGLTVSAEIDPAVPARLRGDVLRLKQILLNFLANAVKFSEQGRITVRVRAEEQDPHGVLLRIEVSDQGIGISPEQMARLFQPFVQADDASTRRFGGSGLGLVIAKRLAQRMGGDGGGSSEVGRGSTFWATVRLKRQHEAPASEARPIVAGQAAAMLRVHHAGRSVLVVDDEPINQEITQLNLESVGLRVDTAADGAEAITLAGKRRYAAILMDVQMPNVDGLSATRQIRRLPGYAMVPILAMTASAYDEDKARCAEAGMSDFLTKPWDPDLLFAALLRAFAPGADA